MGTTQPHEWIARRLGTLLAVSALVLSGCGGGGTQQQAAPQQTPAPVKAPAVTPKISINAVMVGLVDHAAQEIWWAAQPAHAPKTDRDWTELQSHAWQLTASGPAIEAGGTGKLDAEWTADPAWAVFAQQLTDVGATASMAVASRDKEAISKVGDQLVAVCENCHAKFKLALPTGGFLHPPYRN